MLTALQNQQYKTGEPLTDKQIAHIMIALLMAGQHTSAATGAWAILRLGEFPDLQRRLYAEQVEHFYDAATGTWRELEYDTLQTPLLMAFIKELLRCHPPLHSLMRKIILDCPVPTTVGSPAAEPGQSSSWRKRTEGVEYVVPRGEFVLAAPGYSQVDEGIWGPDAKEFRPERWMDQGEGNKVPGEEDEGEEDYGWGKISKGGKSACASPLSLPHSLSLDASSSLSLTRPDDARPPARRSPLRRRPPPMHRRAVCQRPARHHHRDARARERVDARPEVPRQRLHGASPSSSFLSRSQGLAALRASTHVVERG